MDCRRCESKLSFLFESASTTETIGRYSFVGASQYSALLEIGQALTEKILARSSRLGLAMAQRPIHFQSWRRSYRSIVRLSFQV